MPEDEAPTTKSSNIVVLNSHDSTPGQTRLSQFIELNTELIVSEWEAFAKTLTPVSSGMTPLALRDHIHQILAFIVPDMQALSERGTTEIKVSWWQRRN